MNNSITKYKTPSEIPVREYEGYIWYSDEETPRVLTNEDINRSTIKINPFIIEGLLYYKGGGEEISITIRHTGSYQISEVNFNELPENSHLINASYFPHRIKKVSKLKFKQLWLPEEDPNCEGMKVLMMKTLLFTGFEKN